MEYTDRSGNISITYFIAQYMDTRRAEGRMTMMRPMETAKRLKNPEENKYNIKCSKGFLWGKEI